MKSADLDRRIGEVVRLLSEGASLRAATATANVQRRSLYDRMGRDPKLAEAVEQATELGLARLEMNVVSAAALDWRASTRLLEQRDPASWSARAQVELAGRVAVDASVDVVRPDPRIEAMKADPTQAEVLRAFLDLLASASDHGGGDRR